jgi:hypothetical protein
VDPAKIVVILMSVLLMGLGNVSVGAGEEEPDFGIPGSFPNRESIHRWAHQAFFGGFDAFESQHGKTEVLVLIGMPTSGFPTSHLSVFRKTDEGGYELIFTKETVPGIMKIEESPEGLKFKTDRVWLILPWSGASDPLKEF